MGIHTSNDINLLRRDRCLPSTLATGRISTFTETIWDSEGIEGLYGWLAVIVGYYTFV
jgi:hypothetical protein